MTISQLKTQKFIKTSRFHTSIRILLGLNRQFKFNKEKVRNKGRK